jgi:thymidine kinase
MLGFKKGWITVLAGCMSSGKTEELLRLLRRSEIAGANYVIFKNRIDTREDGGIKSRSSSKVVPSTVISNPYEIMSYLDSHPDVDIVAIEEIQFFNKDLLSVMRSLSNRGMRVYATGLNQDFRGEPFETTAFAMAMADKVILLTAVCKKCKQNKATKTQRLLEGEPAPYNSPLIQVGGDESYEARCIDCHEVPGNPY